MSAPILALVSATRRVDLLNHFRLVEWTPGYPLAKGGGSWSDSPMADGRLLVFRRLDDVLETFTLGAVATSQNTFADQLRLLTGQLEQAVEYWTSERQTAFVWLEARGDKETATRYAVVKDYQLSGFTNLFAQPFQSRKGAAQDAVVLTLVHEAWRELPPGQSNCLYAAAQSTYYDLPSTAVNCSPTAGTDDAYVDTNAETIDTGGNALRFGVDVNVDHTGIRFRALNVPQGSKICLAYISGVAKTNQAGAPVNVNIYAEDTAHPAAFSTYYDFMRTRFNNIDRRLTGPTLVHRTVPWYAIPAFVAGTTYTTPDISALVEAVVGRSDWVAGHDITIFFEGGGGSYRDFASWDDPALTAPTLYVEYAAEHTYGQAKTCVREVVTANRCTRAQITYAYHNRGAAWSANLIGSAPGPVDLFPAAPIANGDYLYLGCNSNIRDSGPWANVVFCIGTAAVYVQTASITAEYYNGGWVPLPMIDVRDHEYYMTEPFKQTGVNVLAFRQPTDWQVFAAAPAAAVPGWWIRLVVTIAGGGTISMPTQITREIYTPTWDGIDVDGDDVAGDLPALVNVRAQGLHYVAAGVSYTPIHSNVKRAIVSLRTKGTGKFRPCINLAGVHGEQNDPDISIVSYDGFFTVASRPDAPTGRAMLFTLGVAGDAELDIWLNEDIAPEYVGDYVAILRYLRTVAGTAGDLKARLFINMPSWTFQTPQVNLLNEVDMWFACYLGRVTLPPGRTDSTDLQGIGLELQITNTVAAARTAYFSDLILIPADEFLLDAQGFVFNQGDLTWLTPETEILLDSTSHPRVGTKVEVRADERWTGYGNLLQDYWVLYGQRPFTVQAGRDQQIWFWLEHEDWPAGGCPCNMGLTVRLTKAQRYLLMRGAE